MKFLVYSLILLLAFCVCFEKAIDGKFRFSVLSRNKLNRVHKSHKEDPAAVPSTTTSDPAPTDAATTDAPAEGEEEQAEEVPEEEVPEEEAPDEEAELTSEAPEDEGEEVDEEEEEVDEEEDGEEEEEDESLWPSGLEEVWSEISQRVIGAECLEDDCRTYDQVKSDMIEFASSSQEIGETDDIYYVQTLKKTLHRPDTNQMLFAVLPLSHEDYQAEYKPKIFSVCVKVEKGEGDIYLQENCPLDDCSEEVANDETAKCDIPVNQDTLEVALKNQDHGLDNAVPTTQKALEEAFDGVSGEEEEVQEEDVQEEEQEVDEEEQAEPEVERKTMRKKNRFSLHNHVSHHFRFRKLRHQKNKYW